MERARCVLERRSLSSANSTAPMANASRNTTPRASSPGRTRAGVHWPRRACLSRPRVDTVRGAGKPRRFPWRVLLAQVEAWDPPVAMNTVLSQIDPAENARADFVAGVVRITVGEYETTLAVAVGRGLPSAALDATKVSVARALTRARHVKQDGEASRPALARPQEGRPVRSKQGPARCGIERRASIRLPGAAR